MRLAKKYLDFCSIFRYNRALRNCNRMILRCQRRSLVAVAVYIIFAFCMYGCAQTAFYLGRRDGIEATVEHLVNKGLLDVEEDY